MDNLRKGLCPAAVCTSRKQKKKRTHSPVIVCTNRTERVSSHQSSQADHQLYCCTDTVLPQPGSVHFRLCASCTALLILGNLVLCALCRLCVTTQCTKQHKTMWRCVQFVTLFSVECYKVCVVSAWCCCC